MFICLGCYVNTTVYQAELDGALSSKTQTQNYNAKHKSSDDCEVLLVLDVCSSNILKFIFILFIVLYLFLIILLMSCLLICTS